MSSLIGGRYRVVGTLGSGVLGYVVRVRDETAGVERALKLFNPQEMTETSRGRFEREFQAIARITHPNVVRVHEWGVHGNRPYFVMDLLAGEALDKFLRPHRPAPDAGGFDRFVVLVAMIFRDIADALSAVHGAGVVHRDVKPANVLVAPGPKVTLLDFGHAKEDDERQLTTSGSVVGTASYIAPEHALGQPAGPASDLYALGCVLYECLIGRPPFTDGGVIAVLMSHVNAPAPDPRAKEPRIPAPLAELCLSLLRKAPTDRPESAALVARSFAALA